MKFTITFERRPDTYDRPVVVMPKYRAGLKHIEMASALYGAVQSTFIEDNVASLINYTATVEISSKQAATAPRLFTDTGAVAVTLLSGNLNQFVVEGVKPTMYENGKVMKVEIIQMIDVNSVFNTWKAAGFPLVWNIE